MADLKIGNKRVTDMKYGSQQIKEVWVGNGGGVNLVWQHTVVPGVSTTSISKLSEKRLSQLLNYHGSSADNAASYKMYINNVLTYTGPTSGVPTITLTKQRGTNTFARIDTTSSTGDEFTGPTAHYTVPTIDNIGIRPSAWSSGVHYPAGVDWWKDTFPEGMLPTGLDLMRINIKFRLRATFEDTVRVLSVDEPSTINEGCSDLDDPLLYINIHRMNPNVGNAIPIDIETVYVTTAGDDLMSDIDGVTLDANRWYEIELTLSHKNSSGGISIKSVLRDDNGSVFKSGTQSVYKNSMPSTIQSYHKLFLGMATESDDVTDISYKDLTIKVTENYLSPLAVVNLNSQLNEVDGNTVSNVGIVSGNGSIQKTTVSDTDFFNLLRID